MMKRTSIPAAVGFGFALLGTLVSSLGGPSVQPARAAFPGHNGKIAFDNDDRPSNYRPSIYTMRPDGSHKRRIGRRGHSPAFSPNGRKVVFLRGFLRPDIYVMRADGSHKRRLTHTHAAECGASFSPSGKRILFSGRPYCDDLYTMRADGSHVRRLTHGGQGGFSKFSPNGRRIVTDNACAITIMRADGSHAKRLTDPATGNFDCDLTPDFSPNGKRIVFVRSCGDVCARNDDIYVIRTDGTHLKRLTNGRAYYNENPVFSPRGGRIAFDSDRGRGTAIYTMRADGSRVRRLTHGPINRSQRPSWGVRP
jgi:TolB protein